MPGLHANGCLCSPHSAASDAFCRSFPLLAPLILTQFKQVFRILTGFLLADEMLHPAAEHLNRESVLAAINRAIHPTSASRFNVRRPTRAVAFFPGPSSAHRSTSHERKNSICNDNAFSESSASFGRLHTTVCVRRLHVISALDGICRFPRPGQQLSRRLAGCPSTMR